MMEEVIENTIDRQTKRLKEIVESCSLYSISRYDECNEKCPIYQYCWELQDLEKKNLENCHKSLLKETEK